MQNFLELKDARIVRLCPALLVIVFVCLNKGCAQPDLSLPPLSQKGDISLTVTVHLSGSGQFPTGSQMIITLADITGQETGTVALAGDVVTLSQPDRAVRITFPVDSHKITSCKKKQTCGISVKVVRGKNILYQSSKFVPYQSGQSAVSVKVRRI